MDCETTSVILHIWTHMSTLIAYKSIAYVYLCSCIHIRILCWWNQHFHNLVITMVSCQMQWSIPILYTENSQTIGAINILHGLPYHGRYVSYATHIAISWNSILKVTVRSDYQITQYDIQYKFPYALFTVVAGLPNQQCSRKHSDSTEFAPHWLHLLCRHPSTVSFHPTLPEWKIVVQ